MRLNADLDRPVTVATDRLPWAASPGGEVERRMIERTGDEIARATSIVRFPPASRFPAHGHGGGEEILVLDGVFSDESGDYPAGWYLRNPVGSRHAPGSAPGCTIFVKLWWMHAGDREAVALDSFDPAGWRPGLVAGASWRPLHRWRDEWTMMVRLEAGASLPARALAGGEEMLVVAGACADGDGDYGPLVWRRRPPGRAPALESRAGCTLFIKRGHLADPPAPPGG